MSDGLRPLRVNALELLRQPGATKGIDILLDGGELDVSHDALNGPVAVSVELEALNDGIAVTGTVAAPWSALCRRCLTPLDGDAVCDVAELYQKELTDEDAYPIENNQLDLAPMVRQVTLIELDQEHLCNDRCAGLCPICGIDRNHHTCECDTTVTDDRWAALDGLILDD